MFQVRREVAIMIGLAGLLAACGGSIPSTGSTQSSSPSPAATAASGATGTQVQIESGQRYGFAFSPAVLNTTVGSTVTFTNGSSASHTVTSDTPGQFDLGPVPPNGTVTRTFTAPGTYAYHCKIHTSMKATIQVG